jgi:hypothetical protein
MAFEYYWNRDKIVPIPELNSSLVPIEHILMKILVFNDKMLNIRGLTQMQLFGPSSNKPGHGPRAIDGRYFAVTNDVINAARSLLMNSRDDLKIKAIGSLTFEETLRRKGQKGEQHTWHHRKGRAHVNRRGRKKNNNNALNI